MTLVYLQSLQLNDFPPPHTTFTSSSVVLEQNTLPSSTSEKLLPYTVDQFTGKQDYVFERKAKL